MSDTVSRLVKGAARAAGGYAVTGTGLAGAGLFSFGAGRAWEPAGWMCAGAFLLAGACLTAWGQALRQSRSANDPSAE